MRVSSIEALIKKTEAALLIERKPSKRASLVANLEAYKKTKHHIEHRETEEGDDDDEDEDKDSDEDKDEEDDEEEEASSADSEGGEEDERKSKKAKATAKKKSAYDEEDEESEDAEEDDESQEESAKAVLSMARKATGKRGRAMIGAVAALFEKASKFESLSARVAQIEGVTRKSQRTALIKTALEARRISPHIAKELSTRKLSFVQSYLEMHKRPLVATDEEDLASPNVDEQRSGAKLELPAEIMAHVEEAVRGSGLKGETADGLRAKIIDDHKRRMAAESNGAPGRY